MAPERFYDAIVIGAGPVPSAQLRGAGGSREVALGCAQENHGAWDEELLDGRVYQGLKRGLIDWLESRRSLR